MTVGQDEINVRVTGSAAEVQSAMRDASSAVRTASGQMGDSLTGLDQKLEQIERQIGSMGAAATDSAGRIGFAAGAWTAGFDAITNAVGRALGAISENVGKQIELGDELARMAAKTGMTAEAVTGLAYAAELADVPVASLGAAFKNLQRNVSGADDGATQARDTFADLGVMLTDLKMMTPEQQFELIAQRISEIESPADRVRLAVAAFGRAGAELLPLFEQGAAGIEKARKEAEALHLVLSEKDLKALADTDEATKKLDASFDGLWRQITVKLSPALTALATNMRIALGGATELEELDRQIQALQIQKDISPAFQEQAALDALLAKKRELLNADREIAAFDARSIAIRARNSAGSAPAPYLDPKSVAVPQVTTREIAQEIAARERAQKHIEDLAIRSQVRISAEAVRAAEGTQREIDRILEQFQREQERRDEQRMAVRAKDRELEARTLAESLSRMFEPITNAFEGMLQGVLIGTQTIGQAFDRMGLNIAASIGNMVAQAITNFVKMKVVAVMTGREGALAQIKQNAAVAAGAAWQSAAKIPYVGWILGPIAGAAAYAGVLAFSAKGGFDIPQGVNPMTQLHEREMVLPAKYADVIRAQAEGGGGGKRAVTFSPTINAVDGDGIRRLFQSSEFQREFRRFAGAMA